MLVKYFHTGQHLIILPSSLIIIKSAFFKNASWKKWYLKWLEGSLPKEQVKLPPVSVATRQDFWCNAARYHSSFVQFYERFFKQEKNYGLVVDRILELENNGWLRHAAYHNLCLNLHFINENCTHLLTVLTSLEETKSLLAYVVYNMMGDVKQYLHTGTSKSTFDVETDRLLSDLENTERERVI